MIILFISLAVVNGNSSEEIDSDLVAQHCWLDVMLRFRNVAQTPLGKATYVYVQ